MRLNSRIGISAAVPGTLLLAWIAGMACLLPQGSRRVTGTYTNMYYNEEGGDLLGEELKIVFAGKGFQGALQFAVGEPGQLIVVDIKIEGDKISFSIPDRYSRAGDFYAVFVEGGIKGKFSYRTGSEESVVLRKGKSYWD